MKKLIFQINVPNYIKTDIVTTYTFHSEMYHVSETKAREYAKKCGADYYLLTNPSDYAPATNRHLDYQKLKAFDFVNYDSIIYFDSDYIIKNNAPNLFDLCGNKFHAVPDQGKSVENLALTLSMPRERYFNAGFMYLTKDILNATRNQISKYLEVEYELHGQGLLNKMFFDNNIQFTPLDFREWNPVKRTFGLYADHYAGKRKERWGQANYDN
jgi:lipopolysaccharide biosynthesis glycosyltransferase